MIKCKLFFNIRHGARQQFHAAGSRDTTLRVWDVETAQTVQVLQGHQYQASVSIPSTPLVSAMFTY